MKKDYAHLGVILDRSGSMDNAWDETVKGVENYVEENKKFGEATFSLYAFDNVVEVPHNFVNLKDVKNPVGNIKPRGYTALWDAVCKFIDETGEKLASMKEADRPDQVIVLILTDGQENASKEYDLAKAQKKIKEQREKYNWDFVFLGADFSVDNYAAQTGTQKSFARNISKHDMDASLTSVGAYVNNYRSAKFGLANSLETLGS